PRLHPFPNTTPFRSACFGEVVVPLQIVVLKAHDDACGAGWDDAAGPPPGRVLEEVVGRLARAAATDSPGLDEAGCSRQQHLRAQDRKSTRLNSSHQI